MPYHSIRDEASIDIEMMKLLLEHDVDPNQPVYLHDSETVWGLFLISVNERARTDLSASLTKSWLDACRELIRAGAKLNYKFIQCDLTVSSVLERVFSTSEVKELREEFAEAAEIKGIEAQQDSGRCVVQ